MKKFFNTLKWFILGGLVAIAGTALASQTTVPSPLPTTLPGSFFLQSKTNGLWVASSTQTAYFGNYIATSTGINILTNSNISSLVNLTSNGAIYTAGGGGTLNVIGTSTPTVTAPITYSGTLGQFLGGASGAFSCTNASSGVTGCLTGTDWNTFNGKGSGSVTSVTAGAGFQNQGLVITTTGTLVGAIATSATPTIGNLSYWTATGDASTPAKLGKVATTSETCSGNVSCTAHDVLSGGGAITTINNPTFTTSVTTPITIGGTAAGSSLELRATSGSGTTDFVKITTGNNGGQENARFLDGGWNLFGTTTPLVYGNIMASSTVPQLALGDGVAGDALWTFRNAGGTLYLATTTAQGLATTSTAALTLNPTGVPSLTIGTSTCMTTLKNGSLCLGGGADAQGQTGSTTITASKLQFDITNNTGARSCAFLVGTTWTAIAGACTP